jgi:molybdopterin-dependent oxidoreductase alpha subunit
MRKPKSGGGWQAIRYTLSKAREAGGFWRLWKAMRSKNVCKTCALGMGGQQGGMVNEAGHFPEVCKKSLQAMVADMQGAIHADFFSTYSVAQLQQFTPRELEACGRLTQPLLFTRGENYYQPISWEAALGKIAAKLRGTPADETFWYVSGRSSNEAGFLLQLFARLYGTNNVNNCSYYCHQASGVGLTSVLGSGAGTVQLQDIEDADLVFLIGGNPASNHPRLMTSLKNIRRRGGQIIVVNPVKETGLVNFRVPSDVRSLLFGTEIASLYLQPHIGGDLALMYGVAKRIVEIGAQDQSFLNEHCSGWLELSESLKNLSWEEIEAKSGVSRAEIEDAAQRYADAKNVIFAWTMGITHHLHGVENVQAIANLALLRGMVGKPCSGLLPIRGHSNVQGMGTVGVTPKLKEAIFERLQSHFQIKLPTTPGLDTMACIEAAAAGRLKFGFCLGGNLYGSNPDAAFAGGALGKLETLVYLSTTLNTGHAHGLAHETIILPVLARDEEPQPTTQESMFSYVRLSDGGPRRHEGPRSEIQVIAEIGQRVLGSKSPVDWHSMQQSGRIREAISRIVPGLEPIGEIDRTRQEFSIPGRSFREPRFATADGKARLFVRALPELTGSNGSRLPGLGAGAKPVDLNSCLRLMTVRSEGQFNTVVYEDYDLYRGVDRRDVILVHPDDIRRLDFEPNQRVCVRSETGALNNIILWPFPDIRPGNVLMYYPEANALVPRDVDPQSKTPAFKNVLVTLAPFSPVAHDGKGHQEIVVASSSNGRNSMRAC